MTAITDLGIVSLSMVAFLLGLMVGILITLGAVQLIARLIWHLWIMTRPN